MGRTVKPKHKVLLVVLDGWGIRKERESNAILLAGTPNIDALMNAFPSTEISLKYSAAIPAQTSWTVGLIANRCRKLSSACMMLPPATKKHVV